MSICYHFYAEAKINGVWRWIDPKYPDENGEEKHSVTQGQSSFRATYNYAERGGRSLKGEEVSNELAEKIFKKSGCDDEVFYEAPKIELTFDFIIEQLAKVGEHEHYGFVPREIVSRWETDDLDDIYEWLPAKDFSELSQEAQKGYQYLEWDSLDGWVNGFKALKQIMEVRLKDVKNANYSAKIEEPRFVVAIS